QVALGGSGRDAERHRVAAPEERAVLIDGGDIHQVAGQELIVAEDGLVARQACLVLHAALKVVEHGAGGAALGDLVQLLDVQHVGQLHDPPSITSTSELVERARRACTSRYSGDAISRRTCSMVGNSIRIIRWGSQLPSTRSTLPPRTMYLPP